MKEFVFLYRGGKPPAADEEGRKVTQQWMEWMKTLGEQGHIKDRGNRLAHTGRLVQGRPGALTDGPFAEAKDVIGGYTLVLAEDLEHATRLSKGCPIFARGGHVEVRPVMAM